MTFTEEFTEAYPLPWRVQSVEVVDANGCNVQDFAADTPEDREFWQNIVNAVNGAAARALVPDEELLRVGEKIVEMASMISAAKPGAQAVWHLETDEDRYRIAMMVAAMEEASN